MVPPGRVAGRGCWAPPRIGQVLRTVITTVHGPPALLAEPYSAYVPVTNVSNSNGTIRLETVEGVEGPRVALTPDFSCNWSVKYAALPVEPIDSSAPVPAF
jgi:hypothetical protein